MDQKGWIKSSSAFVDQLRYTYASNNNSNKLLNVNDLSGTQAIKLGDFRTSSLHPQFGSKTASTVDYTYDDNGNLKKDLNKDIGSSGADGITYNYLNLPETVTMRTTGGATKGVITYTYTAAGVKQQKQVVDYSEAGKTITTTTKYIGAEVVESRTISPADAARPDYTHKLLFIGHEEGRIRFEEASGPALCTPQPARFFYDYFLKDHLGNVRMVLTEQAEKRCYIAATVEDATWVSESALYNIVDSRRELKSNTAGTSGYPSFGNKFYRTNGAVSSEKTGLGIVLKVMKGDQVTITAESFYNLPGGNAGTPLTMAASDLFNALVGSSGFPLAKGLTGSDVSAILNNPANATSFINSHNAPINRAKAAVNWVLFDEQMRFVAGDYDPVQDNGGYKNHLKFLTSPVTVSNSGYLYIYVSNESNLKVFFDNLNVTHTPGAILEETHYYPFGLSMAGISSKALNGTAENKYKFNGIERGNDFELNYAEAFYRTLDLQIGRFLQVDPVTSHSESQYASMGNNPILNKDPLGDVFDFNGNKFLEQSYNRLRAENGSKIINYLSQLSGINLNSKDKNTRKEIKVLENLIDRHIEFGNNLREMENSALVFSVSDSKTKDANAAGETSYNYKTQKVDIVLGDFSGSLDDMAHEITHGYQFQSGQMLMGKLNSGMLSDMTDEVKAYQTGYLFSSKARSVAEGNYGIEWFKNKINTDRKWFNAYYKLLGKESSLDINTPAYLLINVLNGKEQELAIKNRNNSNYTVLNMMQEVNSVYSSGQGPSIYNLIPFDKK